MSLSVDEVLERSQWDFFWLPEDSRVVDRPELLYAVCPRNVLGLNVVTRTRPASEAHTTGLVAEVVEAHHQVRSRWMVTPACRNPALEQALTHAGYALQDEHVACALEVSAFVPRPHQGVTAHPVDSLDRLRDWLRVSHLAFNRSLPQDIGYLVRELERCTGPGARVHRFVAYDDVSGEPISSAGLSVFPQLQFGFLWAGGTIPTARHRGGYSAVLEARVRRAREIGLTRIGLYARLETSAPIVLRQGFQEHGRMSYWDRQPC